jgi:probable phosphoglycerate mutase
VLYYSNIKKNEEKSAMPIKLYLARHGKPAMDDQIKRYIGRTDVPLSAEGIAQAEELSRRLARKGIAAIYTSPLRRCKDFAHRIAAKLELSPAIVLEELAELNLGAWENRSIEEIKALYPQEYEERGNNLGEYVTPEGESFVQCQKRAVKALHSIAYNGLDALIISHAGVIRTLLCHVEHRSLEDLFYYKVPYSSIFAFVKDKTGVYKILTEPLKEVTETP